MKIPITIDSTGADTKLVKAIENDELIVFYGAGLSRLAGCLGWNDLAKAIVKALPENVVNKERKDGLVNLASYNPIKVFTICSTICDRIDEKFKEQYYYGVIFDSVTPKDISKFVSLHDKLNNLDPLAFITTNIDRGFESISDSLSLKEKLIINLPESNFLDEEEIIQLIRNGNVFYLHGKIDTDKRSLLNLKKSIFSQDQYFEFYANGIINKFLKIIFNRFTVLFVGYGLEDFEILKSIYSPLNSHKGNNRLINHFNLYAKSDQYEFENNVEYYANFSIKLLPYDNYDSLPEILDYLSNFTISTKQNKVNLHKKIESLK